MSRFSLFDAACNTLWLMEPAALEQCASIVLRANGRLNDADLQAIETRLGRPLDNTYAMHTVQTPAGKVAVQPVTGPLFRHANMLSMVSGAVSVEMLAQDFAKAMADPEIVGIVQVHDSPGGAVPGIAQFAHQMRHRAGSKPVYAWVEGRSLSASYWLASQADRIYADRTAVVGSVGALVSIQTDKAGTVTIVSRQSPMKSMDPADPAARRNLEDVVTGVADVFIADIAAARGTTPQHVIDTYGAGAVFDAAEARNRGMIDGIHSTFDAFLADVFGRGKNGGSVDAAASMSTEPPAASAAATADPHSENDMSIFAKLFKPRDGETEADGKARLEALAAAFPGDANLDFVRESFSAGHDVPAAVAAMRDSHATAIQAQLDNVQRLNDENTRLTAAAGEKDAKIADLESKLTAAQKKVSDLEARPPVAAGGAQGDDDKALTSAFQAGFTKPPRR